LTKRMPTRKRSFRSACTKQMVVSYEQSKRQSLESDRVPTGCVRSASSLSLRLVWRRCHGHATAANAKNMSTPPLDTGNIGFKPRTGIGKSAWIVRVELGQTPFPQTVNSPPTQNCHSYSFCRQLGISRLSRIEESKICRPCGRVRVFPVPQAARPIKRDAILICTA
jgi:hypothetical protein